MFAGLTGGGMTGGGRSRCSPGWREADDGMRAVPGAGRYEGRESLGVRRPRSLRSPGYDKYTCARIFHHPLIYRFYRQICQMTL